MPTSHPLGLIGRADDVPGLTATLFRTSPQLRSSPTNGPRTRWSTPPKRPVCEPLLSSFLVGNSRLLEGGYRTLCPCPVAPHASLAGHAPSIGSVDNYAPRKVDLGCGHGGGPVRGRKCCGVRYVLEAGPAVKQSRSCLRVILERD
jgi:hypothetical protein